MTNETKNRISRIYWGDAAVFLLWLVPMLTLSILMNFNFSLKLDAIIFCGYIALSFLTLLYGLYRLIAKKMHRLRDIGCLFGFIWLILLHIKFVRSIYVATDWILLNLAIVFVRGAFAAATITRISIWLYKRFEQKQVKKDNAAATEVNAESQEPPEDPSTTQ